ncbi:MAG: hypothetical protein IT244_05360 [Bacteroidia bacterium]|nr:hypothetical protein [Bacteroidia bacterium]
MAKGLKYSIGIRALKKRIGLQKQVRRFPPFSEVKEVLLAWDEAQLESDQKHIEKFVKFWESHGKHVIKVVYFHKRKKDKIPAVPDANTLHLSRLDFNPFGMPKTPQVKKIMSTPFDCFINLNMDGRLPLKSLAGFTKSTCRIGYNRHKTFDFYDLILGNPDDNRIDHFIKDLEYYLQKIG